MSPRVAGKIQTRFSFSVLRVLLPLPVPGSAARLIIHMMSVANQSQTWELGWIFWPTPNPRHPCVQCFPRSLVQQLHFLKKRFCIGYFEYLQVIIVSSIVDPVKNEDAPSLPLPMVEVRPEYE